LDAAVATAPSRLSCQQYAGPLRPAGLDSGHRSYSRETPQLQQRDTAATAKRHHSYSRETPQLQQRDTAATAERHRSYSRETPQLQQRDTTATAERHRSYSRETPQLQHNTLTARFHLHPPPCSMASRAPTPPARPAAGRPSGRRSTAANGDGGL
jgi:hypothetical protein